MPDHALKCFVADAVGFVVVVVGLFFLFICSTSVPGGNQVDGLPPASSTESGAQSSRQEADKFGILPLFLLLCLRKIKKTSTSIIFSYTLRYADSEYIGLVARIWRNVNLFSRPEYI